jgi:hypothetical protein
MCLARRFRSQTAAFFTALSRLELPRVQYQLEKFRECFRYCTALYYSDASLTISSYQAIKLSRIARIAKAEIRHPSPGCNDRFFDVENLCHPDESAEFVTLALLSCVVMRTIMLAHGEACEGLDFRSHFG